MNVDTKILNRKMTTQKQFQAGPRVLAGKAGACEAGTLWHNFPRSAAASLRMPRLFQCFSRKGTICLKSKVSLAEARGEWRMRVSGSYSS